MPFQVTEISARQSWVRVVPHTSQAYLSETSMMLIKGPTFSNSGAVLGMKGHDLSPESV
jgi:hypothetical protein